MTKQNGAAQGAEGPARDSTRPVMVGTVQGGGGAPVSVQSMCTTPTSDAPATLAQIGRLADAGCDIVRVAVPSAAALDGLSEICAASPLPVVADIHFDHHLAIAAVAPRRFAETPGTSGAGGASTRSSTRRARPAYPSGSA